MNFKIFKIGAVVLSMLLLLVACGEEKNTTVNTESNEQSEEKMATTISFNSSQYKLAGIQTGKVTKRNISDVIKLNGKIEVDPTNIAVVSAQLGGYIKTAGLIVGTPVKKGQVLATIENIEFVNIQQDYLESINEFTFLEQEYQRQKQLRDEDINSKKTFQKISSQYNILKGKVNALEQKLALIGVNKQRLKNGAVSRTANLYAPISGYIKTSNAVVGNYVSPTNTVFEIINTDKVHLELSAYESSVGQLTIGQKVHFSLANETDFNRIATIEQIGKASGSDRVIIVHCKIDKNSLKGLLPEMYIKSQVEISTNTNMQTVIPSVAIVEYDNKDYIISEEKTSEDDIDFNLIAIKKGVEQDGYTAIEVSEKPLDNLNIITQNAYTVVSALKNSQEGDEGGHGH
ncbi:efflux RND transporter periplasmic adaptor subunit [Maribacter sp. 2304DJ31-5]|uniref:efflux RND transporter periplasmic adaptor subunit n=1 Tax=Maribacter sp. 2304DJ31-5 TaxID=3386273 RepID=UPI0039BD6029